MKCIILRVGAKVTYWGFLSSAEIIWDNLICIRGSESPLMAFPTYAPVGIEKLYFRMCSSWPRWERHGKVIGIFNSLVSWADYLSLISYIDTVSIEALALHWWFYLENLMWTRCDGFSMQEPCGGRRARKSNFYWWWLCNCMELLWIYVVLQSVSFYLDLKY